MARLAKESAPSTLRFLALRFPMHGSDFRSPFSVCVHVTYCPAIKMIFSSAFTGLHVRRRQRFSFCPPGISNGTKTIVAYPP